MLGQSIRDIHPTPLQTGEIGLELEVEGVNLPTVRDKWTMHEDGSLRGEAREYVLRSPVKYVEVTVCLDYLDRQFQKNKTVVNLSRRTSVHVHLNVQDLMIQQIYNLISLGFMLDSLMVEYAGVDRIGNLFCLRAVDAEYLPLSVVSDLRRDKHFHFLNDNIRYASMNLLALRNYGSIEFRAFRGSVNKTEIMNWINVIWALKTAALRYNDPKQLLHDYYDSGPEDFLHRLVPTEFFDQVTGFNRWRRGLERGSEYAFEIAYATTEWLPDIQAVAKKYNETRRYGPGDAPDDDIRFLDKSPEYRAMFLNMERNNGEVAVFGTGRYREYAAYVNRNLPFQAARPVRPAFDENLVGYAAAAAQLNNTNPVDPFRWERINPLPEPPEEDEPDHFRPFHDEDDEVL